MATEVVVNLKVNGLNETNQSLQQLETNIENIQQTTNNVGGAGFNNLSNDVKLSSDKIDEFEKKLKKSVDVGRAAEGVTKTLAGSVNLATSAFAAFGVENEDVQKSLLKVQAAASFATGIKDLTEGFKALNVSGLALNKTLLANPFVLIGTLVVGLISAFVGFENIMKIVTNVVSLAFAPFTALFEAIGLGGSKVDDATSALERYQSTLDEINNTSKVSNALLESEIALLEAQGKGFDVISQKRTELLKEQQKQTEETQKITSNYLDSLKDLQAEETKGSKEYVRLQGEINKAVAEVQNLKAKGIQLDTQIQIEAIKLQSETKKREKETRDKSIEDGKKFSEERKNQLEKEKQDTIKNLQDRLKQEGDLIRENNLKELDVLKNRLLNREITEETFNAERRLLEVKLNEELVKIREKFVITEKEQKTIGAEETKKINEQINKEIIDAERKNIDLRLAINKQNDSDELKAEQEAAKNRLEVIDKDFLRKKQQLLDIAANDETFTQEQLNRELQKLEIEKNEQILLTLTEGSKEYLALENLIKEQRIRLEDDANKEIIAKRDKFNKDLLETTKILVDGIGLIVQDVSKSFESVGQSVLQTFEKISTDVPEVLKKLGDVNLDEQERIAIGLGFIGSSIAQFTEVVNKNAELRIEAIDKEEQERISSLERQKEAGLITEEELKNGRTQIEQEFAKKRFEVQKKAFEQEKAIRIVQAVAQTASAVLNAFSSGVATPLIGPATGAVFAGIAAAFGAAQIALIASQKFPDSGTGGGGSSSVPSTPTPSLAAQGSITPTTFNPQTFGTGVGQEQTFGNSNVVGETTSGVGGGGSQSGGLVLRAYVVESDIASTTNRLSSIREASEL
jgi:hypothetical protein